MSSLNWFKPSNLKHVAWLKYYLSNNYSEIHRDLKNNCLNDNAYASSFKNSIKKYWKDENLRKVNLIKLRNAWDKTKSRNDKGLKSLSIELSGETKQAFSDLAKFHKQKHAVFLVNLMEVFNLQTGKTDIFETAEKRSDKACKIETQKDEIIDLKRIINDKDEEIEHLKVQLIKKQELSSELKAPNKSEENKTSVQELLTKAYEESFTK
tara:strand:- start:6182 stop:6808 length:627 start_codon:yes stop_codon:yes gene_type:complete